MKQRERETPDGGWIPKEREGEGETREKTLNKK